MPFPQRVVHESNVCGKAPGTRKAVVSRGTTPTSVASRSGSIRQTSQCSQARTSRTVSAQSVERRRPRPVSQPWDDTITNLNRYKLDPAMDLHRRMNRISKHKEDAGASFHERLREMEHDVRPFLTKTQPQKPSAAFASKVPTGRQPNQPDGTKGPADLSSSTKQNSVSSRNAIRTLTSLSDLSNGLAALDELPAESSLCSDPGDIAWGDVEEVGEDIARLQAALSWLRNCPYNKHHANFHDTCSTTSSLACNSPSCPTGDAKNAARTNGQLSSQQPAHRPAVASERTISPYVAAGRASLCSTNNATTIPTPCRARARVAGKQAVAGYSNPPPSASKFSGTSSNSTAWLSESDAAFAAAERSGCSEGVDAHNETPSARKARVAEEDKERPSTPSFGMWDTEEKCVKDWHLVRRRSSTVEDAPAPTFRAPHTPPQQWSPLLAAYTGANEKIESHHSLSSATNVELCRPMRAVDDGRVLPRQCSDALGTAPRDIQFGGAYSGPLSDLIDRQADDLRRMLRP
eukprot:GEMP01012030.1.p1 GENE.GEMP01012030.1~~GEMP01012030.1.p1  ORF type:complete len:519 (+),score=111.62 GEMP01012030.1:416-1972(+)